MGVALLLARVDRGGVDGGGNRGGEVAAGRELDSSVEGGEPAADLGDHKVANHELGGRVGAIERVGGLLLSLGGHQASFHLPYRQLLWYKQRMLSIVRLSGGAVNRQNAGSVVYPTEERK